MANKKEVKNETEKKVTKKVESKTTKKTTVKKETKPATKKAETKTVKKEVKTTPKKETVKKETKPATKKTETKTVKKEVKATPKKETVKKETKPAVKKVEKEIKTEVKEPVVEVKTAEKIIEPEKIKIEETKKEIKALKNNKAINVLEKIIVLVAVALVFSLLGYFIGSRHNDKDYTNATKDLELFIEQYNKVINEYYEDVDKNELIKGAITGMLSTLDGYSQVIDDSSNSFVITLEGSYEGLGIEVINNSNGEIEIYNVYDNTPAKKAGVKIGDIVKKINDTDLTNQTTTNFVDMIGQTENIKLTLLRGSKEVVLEMKKEFIVLPSVSSKMLKNKIGYIKVDLFANNTYDQFKTELEKLEKDGMKSLVIDLRDNTGGHLSAVKDMLSLFLDGSHIIYQTQTKTLTEKYYSSGNKDKEYKVVILQNEASASASEIMATALRDELGAYIIGKTSFGKGTVQQLETVEGIGQYKFTTKKWLTSKGEWINEKGVMPDLEVSLTEEYYNSPSDSTDLQLQEAIKYLNEN